MGYVMSVTEMILRTSDQDHSNGWMRFLLGLRTSPWPLIFVPLYIFMTFVLILTFFHHKIMCWGMTTYEYLKTDASQAYNRGYCWNMWKVLMTRPPKMYWTPDDTLPRMVSPQQTQAKTNPNEESLTDQWMNADVSQDPEDSDSEEIPS